MPADLSRILSLLSHELRAPLGVVRGYIRLVEQTSSNLDDRQRKLLGDALRVSERAAALLDEASELARLARAEASFDVRRDSLESTLRAAVAAVVLPEDTPVTITIDRSPECWLQADHTRLRSAFAALISAVGRAQAHTALLRITWAVNVDHAVVDIGQHEDTAADVTLEALRRTSGLGLAVPLAEFVVSAHGGNVSELAIAGRVRGLRITLPASAAGV